MNLPKFSVNNPVAVNLLMWSMIFAGAYYAFNLVRELFPTSDPELISVNVIYPSASPGDIEKSITRRLERETEDVEGIEEIRSTVFEGVSSTLIELEDGVDRNETLSDIRSELDKVTAKLPAGAEEPELTLVRPFFPVISVVLHGAVEESRLREAARDLRDDLLDLPEISRASIVGVRAPEIQAEILPEKLEEYGLTFAEVGRILGQLNMDSPGGTLKNKSGNVGVRTLGEKAEALAWENHVVKSLPDGTVIRLRDIARARATFEDRVERGRFAGKPAVMITITKTPEEDAIAIADAVKEYVRVNPTRLGGALHLDSMNDLTRLISERLDLMLRNAKTGLILVALALALFLELRVAFWVALGLPISFLGTFILMHLFGGTINLISLFALIVVLGLIVDDAIVIGENVFSKIRMGVPPHLAAIDGVNEVAIPVLSAVLTTMVAFLPLAFIDGTIGTFLKQLPIVVIAALGVSLIEAFVILPSHLSHQPKKKKVRFAAFSEKVTAMRAWLFESKMPDLYEQLLRFVLRWRYVFLASTAAISMLVIGLVVAGVIPFVFIQNSDAETVVVDVEMVAGTSEEQTLAVLDQVERICLATQEVQNTFTVLGVVFSDRGKQFSADPATVGQVTVELVSAEKREEDGLRASEPILAEWRKKVANIPGAKKIVFEAKSGGVQGSDIEIRVRGDDLFQLKRAMDHIQSTVSSYEGVEELEDDLNLGKLEVQLSLRDDARELGLTTQDIASQVRFALFGFEIQELQGENEEVKVRVLLPEDSRRTIGDLASLRIETPSRGRVPLQEVAHMKTARSFATLARVDGKRAFTFQAQVDATRGNTSKINSGLEKDFANISRQFPGVSLTFEGNKKQTAESLGSLKIGFVVALLLIYIIIAILFRSYSQPFIVMLAIPYAFIGAIVGHWITGYPFTILSMIGGVALTGIVVNDSLILVDFINRERRRGVAAFEAVIHGGRRRLRAIILTSITTVAGLGPLMLETSFQAQFLIPMAVSIVYGLIFATALTLLVLPATYCVFEDVGRLIMGKRFIGEGEQENKTTSIRIK
ncbi:MAG: HAE1 family hydrophobic/amphiphilic exporter-1 [Planctomycetota bacterium]